MTKVDEFVQQWSFGCTLFLLAFLGAVALWAHERDKQDEAKKEKATIVELPMPTVGPTVAPLCVDETCDDRATKAVCSEWDGNVSCKTYIFVYEKRCTCHRWE